MLRSDSVMSSGYSTASEVDDSMDSKESVFEAVELEWFLREVVALG